MKYGSVCSGIEAATAAWQPLGWKASFFSEIDRFPRAVLKHHYPDVPLHGDFTTINAGDYEPIDALVGGTPCQSFSVAGLRGGLADDRGNLALEYLRLADRLRPDWLVWENVPGVLSSNGGRDFGAILGGMAELGYGFAYRILDAQYCGVPQRRRRVFVVGYLGDWRPAAAVLFERQSLSGDSPPRRQERERVTGTIAARTRGGGWLNFESETVVCAPPLTSNPYGDHQSREGLLITHALRADGFDASEDGTGRGTPLVPVAFSCKDHGADSGDIAPTLRGMGHDKSHANAGGQLAVAVAYRTSPNCGAWETGDRTDALTTGTDQTSSVVAFDMRGRDGGAQFEGPHDTANIRSASGGSSRSYVAASAVRRLTPRECERLMGFSDDYTLIDYRGKPAADGPRYKALGNSMAVPCMRWIGERIETVRAILAAQRRAA